MNQQIIESIGLVAGSFTTISFLPQVIKTWKSRSAKDLSLVMFSLFCAGILLWLIYGILIGSLPVILSNAFTLVLSSTILFFKLKFKD
ncbi:MAG: SemiSWEET transporter [Bacteroidota bacterium]|jgi:MtN3 and saliva related transmembrane protein|nr:SemiSWEET family sugar transporter [Bacteroidota bacterium]MCA4897712.1 SemiSWEET transporter [Cytophagales bacterium]MCE2958475.1 SemiSWEET transporter [Flammeovirgaceae bacterium]MCZ8070627.1 SemiSWEET transporter [Cytophagales bacterium]